MKLNVLDEARCLFSVYSRVNVVAYTLDSLIKPAIRIKSIPAPSKLKARVQRLLFVSGNLLDEMPERRRLI